MREVYAVTLASCEGMEVKMKAADIAGPTYRSCFPSEVKQCLCVKAGRWGSTEMVEGWGSQEPLGDGRKIRFLQDKEGHFGLQASRIGSCNKAGSGLYGRCDLFLPGKQGAASKQQFLQSF